MDSEQRITDEDAEVLENPSDDGVLHQLIVDELGGSIAEVMRLSRRAEEAWHRSQHPTEGLRERKRRLTRRLISDAATTMFSTRGFDNVRVSEVADRVGVSEKTIYNYFPTKESMVLDTADESVEALARALRERRSEESLTEVVVRAIKADTARFDHGPEELTEFLPLFVAMIQDTPALRAAWLEMHDRLATVARDELAAQAGIDPRDPEPAAAGRALAGLVEVAMQSRVRHIGDGLRGQALTDAVNADLDRAGRLLESGLWAFSLLALGVRAKQHAADAALAARDAHAQVVNALRQARAAWNDVRGQSRTAAEQVKADAKQRKADAKQGKADAKQGKADAERARADARSG